MFGEFALIKETNKLREREKKLVQQPKLAVVEETTTCDAIISSSSRQFHRSFSDPLLRELVLRPWRSLAILTDLRCSGKAQRKQRRCLESVAPLKGAAWRSRVSQERLSRSLRSFQERKDRTGESLTDHLRD